MTEQERTAALAGTGMKKHSDEAWGIASQFSYVLASDTRTLAAMIDALVDRKTDALRADNRRLRSRLEIDHCYDIEGNRCELSPEEGDALPDGIECRDATISGLEGRVSELRAENEKLRAELEGARHAIGIVCDPKPKPDETLTCWGAALKEADNATDAPQS